MIVNCWDTTLTVIKYIDRANYNDSIVYTVYKIQKYVHITDTSSSTDITTYYGQSTVYQNETFNQPPFTPIVEGNSYAYVYTMQDNPVHNGAVKTLISEADHLFYDNDSCWYHVMSDGCFPAKQFYAGLGGPYFECYGWMAQVWKKDLVYYKKGGSEWGNPLNIDTTINVNNAISNNKELKIYPNPAPGNFFIENIKNIPALVLILYNSQGVRLITKKLKDKYTRIDVPGLAPGLYFYTIRSQGTIKEKNKVVIY